MLLSTPLLLGLMSLHPALSLAGEPSHEEFTVTTTAYVGDEKGKSCDKHGGGGPLTKSGKKIQEKAYTKGKGGQVYAAAPKNRKELIGCVLTTDDPNFKGVEFLVEDLADRNVVDIAYKNDRGPDGKDGPNCDAANSYDPKPIKFKILKCEGSKPGKGGADDAPRKGQPPQKKLASAKSSSPKAYSRTSSKKSPARKSKSSRKSKSNSGFDFTKPLGG